MVNWWNAQFDTCENKEDIDALISSVCKLILVEGNTLLKNELKVKDYSTKINEDHKKSNSLNKGNRGSRK